MVILSAPRMPEKNMFNGVDDMKLFDFMGFTKTNNNNQKVNVVKPKKVTTDSKDRLGLSPLQILILSYIPSFKTNQTSYASFWNNRYGISNMNDMIQNLLKGGYAKVGDAKDSVSSLKVSELKELLRENNLPVNGSKNVLIDRVLKNCNEEYLSSKISERHYVITDIGAELLKKNEHIPYIHSHSIEDLDIWSIHEMVKKNNNSQFSYRDLIWGYLNKRAIEHYQNHDYGLYRNTRLSQYRFLTEESKWEEALFFLADVIYCDVNDVSNSYDFNDRELLLFSYYTGAQLAYNVKYNKPVPAMYGWLDQLKTELNITESELGDRLCLALERIQRLPLEYFTKKQSVELVMNYYLGFSDVAIKIIEKAKRDFYKSNPKAKQFMK